MSVLAEEYQLGLSRSMWSAVRVGKVREVMLLVMLYGGEVGDGWEELRCDASEGPSASSGEPSWIVGEGSLEEEPPPRKSFLVENLRDRLRERPSCGFMGAAANSTA